MAKANDVPARPTSKYLPLPAKKRKKKGTITCGMAAAALARGKGQ